MFVKRFFMKNKVLVLFLLSLTSLYAEWTDHVTINGYSSFEYEQKIEGDDGDEYRSFDADLFDIVLNVRPSEKVRVAADITWEHGAASEDDRGNVALEYAFSEYIHRDELKFRAGKMYTAFGIYNEIHTAKPATVNFKEPLSTNKIHKIGGDINYFPRWGSGLALLGNVNSFDYIFQLTNGDMTEADQDHNPYDKDDNAHKAFSGRVKANLNNIEYAFSFYHDIFTEYDANVTAVGEGEINSYDVHLIADLFDNFKFQIEAVAGTLKRVNQTQINRQSLSLMGIYDATDTVRIYYINEYFDPNIDMKQDTVTMNTLGVNIELDSSLYIKSEVFNSSAQKNNVKIAGESYNELRTAIVVGF